MCTHSQRAAAPKWRLAGRHGYDLRNKEVNTQRQLCNLIKAQMTIINGNQNQQERKEKVAYHEKQRERKKQNQHFWFCATQPVPHEL